jgi:hypothetical protein
MVAENAVMPSPASRSERIIFSFVQLLAGRLLPKNSIRFSPGEHKTLVPAQHQRLDRKQQGLDAQQHRVHDSDGVDGMQHKTFECAGLL